MFSLLWSEHCGYKHSAPLLKRLPSSGERVLQGPGENAGVIDLGEGVAVAFKVESHNHPSAVEPFQGAATGVGGILRDIVAMGARPIALLDGLRFGEPDWHFKRAVAGIGHYGNCVGVPNVGGECAFDEAYAQNPLVNAMCVGILRTERVLSARAQGIGNLLVLYGAFTGRDGIGGASVLASQDLEGSDEKRPSVQIGDPFRGKALIEVSLDLVERDLVVSLQDCGAAGLASSLSEMARDGMGVDVHLNRVPLRESGLEPWEIMISESQERMVAVVEPVTLRRRARGLRALGASLHRDRRSDRPRRAARVLRRRDRRVDPGGAAHGRVPAVRGRAARASGRAHARRAGERRARRTGCSSSYDQLVGSRTVRRPGLDAAVLRIDGTRGIAVSLDGPPLGCRDPREAGFTAVLEAAMNVACAGGEPLALDRLPELRQPGEGRDRLGARPGDRRNRRRRRVTGHPRRLRKRLAVQRDRRRADPADAGRRLRRPRPRRDAASRTAGRAATACCFCAASVTVSSPSSGGTRTSSRSRTTCPTAASSSRCARQPHGRARDADVDVVDGQGVIVATRQEIPWDDIVELGVVR